MPRGNPNGFRVPLPPGWVGLTDAAEALNGILHDYSGYIIGRMGIPYREKGIQIISVAIDAPTDIINAMSGKIGRLKGVTSKVAYAGE